MSLGSWAQNQLRDAAGAFFGSDYLRDYTHAAQTFRSNSYQYAPKLKFLFHVVFDINPEVTTFSNIGTTNNLSLTVKSAALPNFTLETHQMNQYNRKRIVQTKIKYDPIDITFHDDNGNLARNLWYSYYSYYYNDPNRPVNISAGRSLGEPTKVIPNNGKLVKDYSKRTQYATPQEIEGDNSWGYIGETARSINSNTATSTGETKPPFFRNITIFGFNQHKFSAYTLVNPIITKYSHDQYNYSEGQGVMENKMTVDYETVKYFDGAINGRNPSDIITTFGNLGLYDRTLSPIARPGSQSTILGQGGLVDAANGILQDLTPDENGNINPIAAIQKAGTAYNTFKNLNIKNVASQELKAGVYNSVLNTPNRNNLFQFPVTGQTPGPGQAGQTTGRSSPPPVRD